MALGLISCINFISCMGDKTECALSNFIYDTSSGAVVGTSNGSLLVQRDIEQLEDRAGDRTRLHQKIPDVQEEVKKSPEHIYTSGQAGNCLNKHCWKRPVDHSGCQVLHEPPAWLNG